MWSLPRSSSTATASSFAFAARIRARSANSGANKNFSLAECFVDHGSWHMAPLLNFMRAHDDKVYWHAETAKCRAKPDELCAGTRHFWLDDQDVDITRCPS